MKEVLKASNAKPDIAEENNIKSRLPKFYLIYQKEKVFENGTYTSEYNDCHISARPLNQ